MPMVPAQGPPIKPFGKPRQALTGAASPKTAICLTGSAGILAISISTDRSSEQMGLTGDLLQAGGLSMENEEMEGNPLADKTEISLKKETDTVNKFSEWVSSDSPFGMYLGLHFAWVALEKAKRGSVLRPVGKRKLIQSKMARVRLRMLFDI